MPEARQRGMPARRRARPRCSECGSRFDPPIVEFARVLGVSADDILGIESKRSRPALPAVDKTLARRLAQLQKLPRRDRDALLRTLDAFLAKSSHSA